MDTRSSTQDAGMECPQLLVSAEPIGSKRYREPEDAAVATSSAGGDDDENDELEAQIESDITRAIAEGDEGVLAMVAASKAPGLQLKLSSRNPTGFQGVRFWPQGSRNRPYQAIHPDSTNIGSYLTAVDAAVAYAKAVAAFEALDDKEKKARRRKRPCTPTRCSVR